MQNDPISGRLSPALVDDLQGPPAPGSGEPLVIFLATAQRFPRATKRGSIVFPVEAFRA